MIKSVNEKNNDAILYYIKLLVKGKLIKEDLTKASEYLSKLNKIQEENKYYLQGLISYKQNKYKESSRFYEEGSKKGSLKCMYKYGKLLFIEGIEKNKKEWMQCFSQSKDQGYKKSEYFLTSFNELKKIKKFSELPPETQIIFITNNIKNFKNKSKSQYHQFLLHPKKTEKLFFNQSMKSPIFYDMLKRYENI